MALVVHPVTRHGLEGPISIPFYRMDGLDLGRSHSGGAAAGLAARSIRRGQEPLGARKKKKVTTAGSEASCPKIKKKKNKTDEKNSKKTKKKKKKAKKNNGARYSPQTKKK